MYLNMISSNGTFLPIDKYTRVLGNFRSIIDHVITNDISNTIFPCVFLSDIIDHFPIAIIVERKNKQQDNSRYNKQPYFFRNLKKFNYDSFINNLQSSINTFWHSLSFKYSNKTDKLFSNFIELVSATINMHAPLKKASCKKCKLMNKPWITKGILVSIRRKQKLYINFFKNGTEIEKILYKTYANKSKV